MKKTKNEIVPINPNQSNILSELLMSTEMSSFSDFGEKANDKVTFSRDNGDNIEVRRTESGRIVAKGSINNRKNKNSITKYPNGTTHKTETVKKK